MKSELPTESDRVVKFSRRGLWFTLALLLALGVSAVAVNVFPDSAASALITPLMKLLPIAIVIAIGFVYSPLSAPRISTQGKAMKDALNDELRQRALNRAYRNSLVAVLVSQPALAVLLTLQPLSNAVVLMGGATGLIGVGTVLCSMLWYDR